MVEITSGDLETAQYNYYLTLVSITILYYDYILTFVEEMDRVWFNGGLSWASGLFYLNRYLTLFGHIPVVLEYFWTTSNPNKTMASLRTLCKSLQSFHQYLAIAIQLIVAAMLVMRIYALYERSRAVLFVYLFIIASVFSVGCWAVLGTKREEETELYLPVGCSATLTHHEAIRLSIAWASMMPFDVLVFIMTVYKTFTLTQLRETSILNVLLLDGAMYFGIIILANLANVLTLVYGNAFTRGVSTTFTNIISSVMVSRLMLNLRDPSLVSHEKRTWYPGGSEDPACPNLTFVEQGGSTVLSNDDSILPSAIGNRRIYDYIAGSSGSGRQAKNESEPTKE